MAYIEIDEIVREACADDGDTLHLYSDYLRYALRGVRELTIMLGIPLSSKTVSLPINANNTVDLPKDYVDYQKIGIVRENGNISVLDLNDKIYPVEQDNSCGEPTKRIISGDDRRGNGIDGIYYFANYYINGRNVGSLYGHGGGYNRHGAYRPNISRESWNIQLSSEVKGNNIILEYSPNGINFGGKTSILEQCYETLLYWIKWKRDESKPSLSLATVMESERKFFAVAGRLKRVMLSFTIEELKAATRKSFSQAIKN